MTPASASRGDMSQPDAAAYRFTEEHLAHWREHGYVIVPDFLSPGQLAAAHEKFHGYVPTQAEYEATPRR